MQNDNEDTKNEDQELIKPQGGDVFHPDSVSASGAMTSTSPEVTEADNKPTLAIPPEPIKPKKKLFKKTAITLFALLLIPAIVAGWILIQPDKDSNNSTQSKETQDIELLVIGTTEGPASVYFPDEGVNGIQNIIDHQIYEGLVSLENNKIIPQLAESWTNPDEKTWVFKIRSNVFFHSGRPVTAKDVKASLDQLKTYGYWSLFVSTVDSVDATGDMELTIRTKEPDALLLNRLVLAYVYDLTNGGKPGNDGTGAYQVDNSAVNDEKSTTLIAYDKYYLGHVKTRKLQYKIFNNDAEIIEALKNNQIDIAETLPIPSITEAMKDADYANINYTSPGIFGLYMNQRRDATPIMKNKDFRTALALAMNRQELVDKTGNRSEPVTQVIPESLPGYDETVSFPAFDLVAAKQALIKSGYKNQQIELIAVEEVQVDPPVIIEQLKALGLNLKVKSYKADDLDTALNELDAAKFDLFVAGYTSDISDARDILGALLSSTESTYAVYSDPVYDKLLADSDTTFDPVARITKLQQASKRIADEVSWIPLRNSSYIAYYPKDIDIKIEFNGGGSIGAYYWKVGRITK